MAARRSREYVSPPACIPCEAGEPAREAIMRGRWLGVVGVLGLAAAAFTRAPARLFAEPAPTLLN